MKAWAHRREGVGVKALGREGVKTFDLRGDCPQNIILDIKLLCCLFINLLSYVKVCLSVILLPWALTDRSILCWLTTFNNSLCALVTPYLRQPNYMLIIIIICSDS